MSNVIMFPKQRIVRQIPVFDTPQAVATDLKALERHRDAELSLLSAILGAAVRKFKQALANAPEPVQAQCAAACDPLASLGPIEHQDPRAGRA